MAIKRKEFLLWSSFLMTSLLCSFYLAIYNHSRDNYDFIAALPLVFFLSSILFVKVYTILIRNIGVLCLHCIMFVRLVVTPFFMTRADYDSLFGNISQKNINYAIALLCYECFMVYLVLFILVTNNKGKSLPAKCDLNYNKPSPLFTFIVFAVTVYCLVVWFAVPTCRDLYETIFEFGRAGYSTVSYATTDEQIGTWARTLQTLFKVFFDIVRLVLPMYFIVSLKRRGRNPILSLVAGGLLAFSQLFFISTTVARAILCAFLIVYFISRLYPEYAKKIASVAIILTVAVVVLYFVIRFAAGSRYGSSPAVYLSRTLNAYFCGIDNVAMGANLPEGYEASTFFASLYSAIPFNSTLFGLKVENLQSIYNAVNGINGQIPPMILEGSYYFGDFFAPVMSCICAAGAYHYGEKYANTNSVWHLISNLFIAIMCAISVGMYNEEIILVWLLEWLVPMKILSWLADKEIAG